MKIICNNDLFSSGLKEIEKNYNVNNSVVIEAEKTTSDRGYILEKIDNGYRIEYGEKSNFFNALGLLLSGIENAKRQEYAPRMGVMLDCARNAVPTVAFVKEYIKDMVLMGYNYVGLYLEDLIEVENEPYLGWKRGRYSEKEIKEIIDYADMFGVEIVPYMETLAHMDAMFRCPYWPNYNSIFDFRDCLLIGEPATYEFLDRLISAVAKYFKTKRIHIGMDEADMAGRGHYLNKFGPADKKAILFEHLEKVLDICDKYGLQAEMWSDMIFNRRDASKDEDLLKDKKKLAILNRVKLIYWEYSNNDANVYKNVFERISKATNNYGFAGAGWGFVGLTPLNAYGIENIHAATTACKEYKVDDVCMTLWGDLSGEASFYSTIPTLIRAISNVTDGGLSEIYQSKLTKFLFNYTYDELMETDLPNSVKAVKRNNTAFCLMANDVLLDLMGLMANYGYDEQYKKITARLKELSKRNSKISYMFEALYKMTYCLEIKSVITLWLKDAYKAGNKAELLRLAEEVLPELVIRTKVHLKNMQSHWLKEKKSFGLDNVAMRISAGMCQMEYAIERIKAYVNGDIEKIEEYEEMDLKYFSFWGDENYRDKNSVTYTDWYNMVTNSRVHFSNNPYNG